MENKMRKSAQEENRLSILEGKNYKKSNDLINAKGRSTLLIQKLFAVSIQQAEMDEKGMLNASIYGSDLKRVFGVTSNNFYKTIKEAIQPSKKSKPSILDYRIVISNDEQKSIEAINVITDCKFENGIFNIRFNDKVTKELWELKANYTTFALEETLALKSIYSFRIYELLKSEYDKQDYILKKQGLPSREPYIVVMHLTDLKLKLGIIDAQSSNDIITALKKDSTNYDKIEALTDNDEEAKKFKEYGDLRKNALEKAKKELKEKTDIYFDYEPIRSGRGGKTKSIRFFIFNKNARKGTAIKEKNLTQEEKDNIIDEVSEIINEKLKVRDYKKIAEAADYNIEKVKKAYEIAVGSKKIDNLVGFLIAAIKDEYDEPVKKKTIDLWHGEYVQQTIDFKELENQLLDN